MSRNDPMNENNKIFKSPATSRGLVKLTKEKLIKVLDDSKTFNHFTREEKLILCKLTNQLVFNKKGEYILHEGEKGTSLFILLKGEVVITKNINKSITIATLGPGEIYGEISVFLHRKRNSNSVAKKDTVSLEIDMPLMQKMGDLMEKKFYRLAVEALAIKLDRTNDALVEVNNALLKAKDFSIADLHSNL